MAHDKVNPIFFLHDLKELVRMELVQIIKTNFKFKNLFSTGIIFIESFMFIFENFFKRIKGMQQILHTFNFLNKLNPSCHFITLLFFLLYAYISISLLLRTFLTIKRAKSRLWFLNKDQLKKNIYLYNY